MSRAIALACRAWGRAAFRVAGTAGMLVLAVSLAAMAQGPPAPEGPTPKAPPAAPPKPDRMAEAEQKAAAALAAKEPADEQAGDKPAANPADEIPPMNYWEMTVAGGPLMIPIGLFSVLVLAVGFERFVALRRGAVLPRRLLAKLKTLSHPQHGLEPREAARACREHPSAAANVIRAMLSKSGASRADMEQAAQEAAQREADRLGGPVRWLNLSAAVAPMLGLLGTVQGMIQCFYITSNLPIGANRAFYLAKGIYVALVTTFGGLTVAIPAAILAHHFAGRIRKLFGELDEAVVVLGGQVERHGRRHHAAKGPPAAPPVEPPPPPGEARSKHPAPTRP